MIAANGILNIVLGLLYVSFGMLTVSELRRHWGDRGPSPFALAWAAIFFTCGPHHLEHGMHVLVDRTAGGADLVTVVFGLAPGLAFLALRTEELHGGRGDRLLSGRVGRLFIPIFVVSLVSILVANIAGAIAIGATITLALLPNFLLLVVYVAIAVTAGATQLHNQHSTGQWSLAGTSLTGVFITCAAMHAAWIMYVATGVYQVHGHLYVIDLLGIPAGVYFLWVIHGLARGDLGDWNQGARANLRQVDAVPDVRQLLDV